MAVADRDRDIAWAAESWLMFLQREHAIAKDGIRALLRKATPRQDKRNSPPAQERSGEF